MIDFLANNLTTVIFAATWVLLILVAIGIEAGEFVLALGVVAVVVAITAALAAPPNVPVAMTFIALPLGAAAVIAIGLAIGARRR